MKNENAVCRRLHEALRNAALSLLEKRLLRNGFRMDRRTLALSHCVDRLDAKALTGDASGRSTVCVKGNPSIYKEYRDELEKDSFNDLS